MDKSLLFRTLLNNGGPVGPPEELGINGTYVAIDWYEFFLF